MATSGQIGRKTKDIEIFRASWTKARKGRVAQGVEAEIITGRLWAVGFDAREWVAVMGDAAAVGVYLSLQGNYDPATLRQREPSKDRDPRRMMRSGRFASKIQRTKVTGTKDKARCKVRGPTTGKNGGIYMAALQAEAVGLSASGKRREKNLYFRVDGAQGALMDESLQRYLKSEVKGVVFSISIGRRFAKEVIETRASGRIRGMSL